MESYKNKRSNKLSRRKNTGNRSRAGRKAAYVRHPYTGPIYSPPLPKELSCALTYNTTLFASGLIAESVNTFGLFEFLSRRPLYDFELFAIYKYCKITAVTINLQAINTGVTAAQVFMGVVPFNDISTLTSLQLLEKPGTVRKVISPAGGMDRCNLTKSYVGQDWIGNENWTKFWFTDTQASSGTPVDTNEPVVAVVLDNLPSSITPFTMQVAVKITYHCQFFDLEAAPTH